MNTNPLSQKELVRYHEWLDGELKKIVPTIVFRWTQEGRQDLAKRYYDKKKIIIGIPSITLKVNGLVVSKFNRDECTVNEFP